MVPTPFGNQRMEFPPMDERHDVLVPMNIGRAARCLRRNLRNRAACTSPGTLSAAGNDQLALEGPGKRLLVFGGRHQLQEQSRPISPRAGFGRWAPGGVELAG